MRMVLDTNILARSAYSVTGPAWELLDRIRRSEHVLIVSSFILSELDRVLRYPRLARYHGLSHDEIARYVADIEAASLVVETVGQIAEAVVVPDPDDDPIVATAVAGRADILCTLERHLHEANVRAWCVSHGIRVVNDVELLTELRGEVG